MAVADATGDVGQLLDRQVRRVHADLHDRGARRQRHVGVGLREPVGEAGATLLVHRPAGQPPHQVLGAGGLREVAGQRHVPQPRVREHLLADVEGVEDARRGQLGGRVVTDVPAEPGLGLAGDGCLGHHQHGGRRPPHDSTRAKSRAARTVPRTEPETLERVPSARGR